MAVDDPGEDVGQVRERIDVVPSFNLRVSIREAMFGAAVRSCEQRIFPVECDQTDGAFDGIVVEFNATVVDETRQPFPARESIADGVRERATIAQMPRRASGFSAAERCAAPRRRGRGSSSRWRKIRRRSTHDRGVTSAHSTAPGNQHSPRICQARPAHHRKAPDSL